MSGQMLSSWTWSAALDARAAAEWITTAAHQESVDAGLAALQSQLTGTGDERLGDLSSALSQYTTANGGDDAALLAEAKALVARAVAGLPNDVWHQTIFPAFPVRHWNLGYLTEVHSGLRRILGNRTYTMAVGRDEDKAFVRTVVGGLSLFLDRVEEANDADIAGRVEEVAAQIQDVGLRTFAQEAGVSFPPLPSDPKRTSVPSPGPRIEEGPAEPAEERPAPSPAGGLLSFDYHPDSESRIDHRAFDMTLESIVRKMEDGDVHWPYDFRRWARSLYLWAGELPNGESPRVRNNISRGLGRLDDLPTFTVADIRRLFGPSTIALDRPLPGLPADWPKDMSNDFGSALVVAWDAATSLGEPRFRTVADVAQMLWTRSASLPKEAEIRGDLKWLIRTLEGRLRNEEETDFDYLGRRLKQINEKLPEPSQIPFELDQRKPTPPPEGSDEPPWTQAEWVEKAADFLRYERHRWGEVDEGQPVTRAWEETALRLGEADPSTPQALQDLKLLFHLTITYRQALGVSGEIALAIGRDTATRMSPLVLAEALELMREGGFRWEILSEWAEKANKDPRSYQTLLGPDGLSDLVGRYTEYLRTGDEDALRRASQDFVQNNPELRLTAPMVKALLSYFIGIFDPDFDAEEISRIFQRLPRPEAPHVGAGGFEEFDDLFRDLDAEARYTAYGQVFMKVVALTHVVRPTANMTPALEAKLRRIFMMYAKWIEKLYRNYWNRLRETGASDFERAYEETFARSTYKDRYREEYRRLFLGLVQLFDSRRDIAQLVHDSILRNEVSFESPDYKRRRVPAAGGPPEEASEAAPAEGEGASPVEAAPPAADAAPPRSEPVSEDTAAPPAPRPPAVSEDEFAAPAVVAAEGIDAGEARHPFEDAGTLDLDGFLAEGPAGGPSEPVPEPSPEPVVAAGPPAPSAPPPPEPTRPPPPPAEPPRPIVLPREIAAFVADWRLQAIHRIAIADMLSAVPPETVLNVLRRIDEGSDSRERKLRRLETYAKVIEQKRLTNRGRQKLLEAMASDQTFGRVWPLLLLAAVKPVGFTLDQILPEPLQLGRKFGRHVAKWEERRSAALLVRPAVTREEGLFGERAVTASGSSLIVSWGHHHRRGRHRDRRGRGDRSRTVDIGVQAGQIVGDFDLIKSIVKGVGAVASGKRTDLTLIAMAPEMTPRARYFFFTHHPKGTLILWQGERFSVHRLHDARSEKIDEYREDGSVIRQSLFRFPEMSGVLEVHAISETDWNPETHRSIVGPTEKAMERLRELKAGRQATTLKVVRDAAIYAVGFLKPDHEDAARILSICRKFSSQIKLSAEIIDVIREELDRAVKEIEHRFDPTVQTSTATRPPPEPSPTAPPHDPEPEAEPRAAGPVGPRAEPPRRHDPPDPPEPPEPPPPSPPREEIIADWAGRMGLPPALANTIFDSVQALERLTSPDTISRLMGLAVQAASMGGMAVDAFLTDLVQDLALLGRRGSPKAVEGVIQDLLKGEDPNLFLERRPLLSQLAGLSRQRGWKPKLARLVPSELDGGLAMLKDNRLLVVIPTGEAPFDATTRQSEADLQKAQVAISQKRIGGVTVVFLGRHGATKEGRDLLWNLFGSHLEIWSLPNLEAETAHMYHLGEASRDPKGVHFAVERGSTMHRNLDEEEVFIARTDPPERRPLLNPRSPRGELGIMAGGNTDLAEAVSLDHATFLNETCRPLLGEKYGILVMRLGAYHGRRGNVARLLDNLALIHEKGGPESIRSLLEDLVSPGSDSSDSWEDSLLKGIGRFGEMAGVHPIAALLWPSVRDDAFTPRHGKALGLLHREAHGTPAETLDVVRRLAQAWKVDWLTTLDRLALILRKPDDPRAELPRNLRSWFRGMLEGRISDPYIAAVFNQFALYHRVGLALADSYFTVKPGKALRVVAEGTRLVTRSEESLSGPCNLPLLADGRAVLYASADKANLGLTVSRVDLVDAMALTSQTGQKAVWVVETLKEILPGTLRLFWQLHPEGEVIWVRGDQVARLRHEEGEMVTRIGETETRAPFRTRPQTGDIVLEGLTPELDPEWNPEEADWPALFAKAGIEPKKIWGPLRELFSLPDLEGPLTPDNLTTWLGDIRIGLEAHLSHLSVAHDLFPNAPELFPTEKSTEWKDRADALEIRALEAYTSSANEAEGTAKILGLATVAEEIREIVREILETELTGYRQLLDRVAPRLARDDRPESLDRIMDQLPVMIGQVGNYDIDLGPGFFSNLSQVRGVLANIARLLNHHASLQAPSGSYRYQSRADLELPPTKPTFEDLAAFLKQHGFVEERDIGGQAVLFREPRSGVSQKIERRLEHFENVRKNNRMYAIRAVEAALRKQGLMAPDVVPAANAPAPSAADEAGPPEAETLAAGRRPTDDEGPSEVEVLSRRAETDLAVLQDLLDRAPRDVTARKALEGMKDLRHHLGRLEDTDTRAAIEALVPYNDLARRAKRRREASVPRGPVAAAVPAVRPEPARAAAEPRTPTPPPMPVAAVEPPPLARLETRAVTPVPAVVQAPAAAIANGVAEPEPAALPPSNPFRTARQIIERLLDQRTIESHDPQSENYYPALSLLSSLSDGELSTLADELIPHLMNLAGKLIGRNRPKQIALVGILRRIFAVLSDGPRAGYRERIAGHKSSRVKLDADGTGEKPILEALFPPPRESGTLRRARNLINDLTSPAEIQRFIRSTGREETEFYNPLEEALSALQADDLDILAEALIPDLIETTIKKAMRGRDGASSMYINICRRVFLYMGGPQKAKYRERLQASPIGNVFINMGGLPVSLMSNLF